MYNTDIDTLTKDLSLTKSKLNIISKENNNLKIDNIVLQEENIVYNQQVDSLISTNILNEKLVTDLKHSLDNYEIQLKQHRIDLDFSKNESLQSTECYNELQIKFNNILVENEKKDERITSLEE